MYDKYCTSNHCGKAVVHNKQWSFGGKKSSTVSHYITINSKCIDDLKYQKSNHERTRNYGRITFEIHSAKGPTMRKNSFFFFWPHRVAYGILVPRPGIEPAPPELEAWSLSHWTAREVPENFSIFFKQPEIMA